MTSNISTKSSPTAAHVPELDGIRGVAVLAVMLLHFYSSQITTPHSTFELIAGRITGFGMWGVDLFFVLSGYLITGILWDTRGTKRYFQTFYMRRTLRIFPLYYGVLFVSTILLPASLLQRFAPDALQIREIQIWLWPYATNFYLAKQGSFSIPYVSHFWSLAVEEHFYLFWPLVVGKLSRSGILRSAVILGLLSVVARVVLHFYGSNALVGHVITPCRLDSLCIGAGFSLLIRGDGGVDAVGKKLQRILPLGIVGLVVFMILHKSGSQFDALLVPLKELLLAFLCAGTICLAAWRSGPQFLKSSLRMSWLRWLGKYSYGLYVFHAIISYAFISKNTLPLFSGLFASRDLGFVFQGLIGIVLSCIISWASFEFYELHFLKLKRFFEPVTRD
jgi:peptidoglycan/LPS O-acetylase OafA/YrhL